MKISKLFHWLYAILMLLPVFFIGVRCAYTVFNKNAKDSYSETLNEVNFVEIGKTYYSYKNINENGTSFGRVFAISATLLSSNTSIQQSFNQNFGITFTSFQYNSETRQLIGYDDNASNTFNVTFTLGNYFSLTLVSAMNRQISGLYTMEYTLDNTFEYSVNQLNEVPLFSWAKDSFLVQPFSYITGLFGLESTSPINTMLSYWLNISIIWLVFDLVMYVPLLVHRWLDKGVLE